MEMAVEDERGYPGREAATTRGDFLNTGWTPFADRLEGVRHTVSVLNTPDSFLNTP